MRFLKKLLKRMTQFVCIAVLLLTVLLVSCQHRMIYYPRPYAAGAVAAWQAKPGHEVLEFRTSAGPQRMFLQQGSTKPAHLWIVCGGNGSLALEWSSWLAQNGPAGDAYLLLEIPGYGECVGKANPAKVSETIQAAVPMAMEKLGWSPQHDRAKLRIFGHSLGCAVTLMAADAFDIRQGVLISPFTSMMAMSRQAIGLPLGFLVRHRYDNAARLKSLARFDDLKMEIFHGTDDEVIPCWMAHELAKSKPGAIRVHEVPGAHHNDVHVRCADELKRQLN